MSDGRHEIATMPAAKRRKARESSAAIAAHVVDVDVDGAGDGAHGGGDDGDDEDVEAAGREVGDADDALLKAAKRQLRVQLLDEHTPTLVLGLDEQQNKLYDVLNRTLTTGEGNSVLLLGPRGSGKTLAVRSVLHRLRDERAGSGGDAAEAFRVVWLNGLLQVNDPSALKEIARQLCVDPEVVVEGGRRGGAPSAAAAPATERTGDGDPTHEGATRSLRFGSFADTLALIVESLVSGGREAVPLVFVLEEFEQFALASSMGAQLGGGRELTKQLLLYNLFDAAQAYEVPMCVVGLSCRIDAVELLEKRVKSRFSHRQIQFYASYSFDDYMRLFADALTLPATVPGGGGGSSSSSSSSSDNRGRVAPQRRRPARGMAVDAREWRAFVSAWNAHVDAMAADQDLRRLFEQEYERNRSVRGLHRVMFPAVCALGRDGKRTLCTEDFDAVLKAQSRDAKGQLVSGLSVSELCLVISMNKLQERFEREPINFAMVYAEWQSFWRQHSLMTSQLSSREAAFKAFEHLLRLELVSTARSGVSGAGGGGGNGGGGSSLMEFAMVKLMLEPEQVLDAVRRFPRLPEAIRRWALSDVNATI